MKRYQLYLNPHSVSILDDFEKISHLSRSKVIRELLDRYVDQLVKVFSNREDQPVKYTHFDKLVGAIRLKTKRPTNFALDEDEIYLQD